MKIGIWGGMILVLLCLATTPAFAATEMQPGEWEMTMKTEMPGMPFPIPPMKYKMCLTPEKMVPQQQDPKQECKMLENKVVGSTVSWVMECRDKQGVTRSEGSITYQRESMEGTIHTTIDSKQDGAMEMNQKLSGKRLGACGK
ncbi:hypothetical protein JCM30471_28020 [Desulfuromonas carbonis]|uniref:DUF3617 domain-containing protein n=1 Tax=Desulfuromonas sp. DDH964 TaxID=1823759 RepID=UPI00078E5F57|nr:DUF3617 family protein [Desulfuromonas sp. DDH964]AMV70983.1 hypothetical protein DBW_0591 [Desulfuromonas sp. DDH964]